MIPAFLDVNIRICLSVLAATLKFTISDSSQARLATGLLAAYSWCRYKINIKIMLSTHWFSLYVLLKP